jgi:hypothetical protein
MLPTGGPQNDFEFVVCGMMVAPRSSILIDTGSLRLDRASAFVFTHWAICPVYVQLTRVIINIH